MSFLTGYRRKEAEASEERTGGRERRQAERREGFRRVRGVAGRGVARAERERNDNPFDGHNAARHRKAHQTRNTANRLLPSPFRSPRRLSICFHLSSFPLPATLLPVPSSYHGRKLAANLPWLYANRHRSPGPVINLLNYITRTRCPSVQPSSAPREPGLRPFCSRFPIHRPFSCGYF